jgi:hypothetical protein
MHRTYEPSPDVTLRFTFVALSVLAGALLFALLAMFITHALYVAANGHPTQPDGALFILLALACVCAAPIGSSLALLIALLVLYTLNVRSRRSHQAA